jgi:gamma-glutamylcyclotransferase (GGCT)/AIG2-like uncharacterized protein YtfP
MLYFAYGMNTNTQGMARRCPGAVAFGRARLLGHRFRFAGPADVQIDCRDYVDGVLWDLTDNCLKALDMLEGYPSYYDRKYATVEFGQGEYSALVYFMQPGNKNSPPSDGYFNMVLEGYTEFAVPTTQLYKNVNESITFLPY